MIDLKPYYDAARAADDEVQRVMAEMHEHFNAGTEDGKQAALDLRPALDEAKSKADGANLLYISMRDAAAQSNSVAKAFVPVSDEAQAVVNKPRVIKRAEYEQMSLVDRSQFIREGGKLED